MSTIMLIRKHINKLPLAQLFTTRDFLSYGSRAAVDKGLSKLVRTGYIDRIARGVFTRQGTKQTKFSAQEVATIKAESFGKKIVSHARDAACRLGLIEEGNQQPTFAVSGSSSSFMFGQQRIFLKKTSQRRMSLGDSKAGEIIRSLCHLGKAMVNNEAVGMVNKLLDRITRQELRTSGAFMPSWLNDQFVSFNRHPMRLQAAS